MSNRLIPISRRLAREVDGLSFSQPVTHVYNPLTYARRPHEQYLELWGGGRKRVLLFGMNPGPWGMAQTGVPFGEVGLVRDWIGVEADVDRPRDEHPKRPIEGFACTRSEVSGSRLWGWIRDRWKTPERFFADHFITNYCPLVFMEESGRNRTPDKLPKAEAEPLLDACDRALRSLVEVIEPELIVGVGVFAETRARNVLGETGVRIGRLLHPSPASPAANRGWAEAADRQYDELTSG